jgi:hypothetical protein
MKTYIYKNKRSESKIQMSSLGLVRVWRRELPASLQLVKNLFRVQKVRRGEAVPMLFVLQAGRVEVLNV